MATAANPHNHPGDVAAGDHDRAAAAATAAAVLGSSLHPNLLHLVLSPTSLQPAPVAYLTEPRDLTEEPKAGDCEAAGNQPPAAAAASKDASQTATQHQNGSSADEAGPSSGGNAAGIFCQAGSKVAAAGADSIQDARQPADEERGAVVQPAGGPLPPLPRLALKGDATLASMSSCPSGSSAVGRGSSGINGSSGMNDINDINGINGINGGINGSSAVGSGSSGINGSSGISGINGINDINGINGVSGSTSNAAPAELGLRVANTCRGTAMDMLMEVLLQTVSLQDTVTILLKMGSHSAWGGFRDHATALVTAALRPDAASSAATGAAAASLEPPTPAHSAPSAVPGATSGLTASGGGGGGAAPAEAAGGAPSSDLAGDVDTVAAASAAAAAAVSFAAAMLLRNQSLLQQLPHPAESSAAQPNPQLPSPIPGGLSEGGLAAEEEGGPAAAVAAALAAASGVTPPYDDGAAGSGRELALVARQRAQSDGLCLQPAPAPGSFATRGGAMSWSGGPPPTQTHGSVVNHGGGGGGGGPFGSPLSLCGDPVTGGTDPPSADPPIVIEAHGSGEWVVADLLGPAVQEKIQNVLNTCHPHIRVEHFDVGVLHWLLQLQLHFGELSAVYALHVLETSSGLEEIRNMRAFIVTRLMDCYDQMTWATDPQGYAMRTLNPDLVAVLENLIQSDRGLRWESFDPKVLYTIRDIRAPDAVHARLSQVSAQELAVVRNVPAYLYTLLSKRGRTAKQAAAHRQQLLARLEELLTPHSAATQQAGLGGAGGGGGGGGGCMGLLQGSGLQGMGGGMGGGLLYNGMGGGLGGGLDGGLGGGLGALLASLQS
ncbi:hypothetical protein PLESTF_001451200 [Pleodorina starrii]|nr:hypothetical protein PLESTM_000590200 [Pleodorina starrii]GLC74022.1 hypothetical protein PLESTF_001451200 [Pleodorina starrii]